MNIPELVSINPMLYIEYISCIDGKVLKLCFACAVNMVRKYKGRQQVTKIKLKLDEEGYCTKCGITL